MRVRARFLQLRALGAGPTKRGRPLLRAAMAVAIGAGFVGALLIAANPAVAATPGLTLRVTSLSPLVAVIAGILILIMPSLLNYIVALYLILIGLLGFFGR